MNHCASFGMTALQCEVARQSGGRSKGWALCDFATPEEAQNAIAQMHNSEIQGRSIIVRVERPGAGQKAARVETRQENSSGLQIVVRNLPWTTTSEDLRQVFQQVGNVVSASAVCHTDTGRSKGWGTVLFETREQAQAAIQGFNGVELEHRPMQIKLDRFD
jgi:RNA recognition motif-containing protein